MSGSRVGARSHFAIARVTGDIADLRFERAVSLIVRSSRSSPAASVVGKHVARADRASGWERGSRDGGRVAMPAFATVFRTARTSARGSATA
jgi:hypothetical protein